MDLGAWLRSLGLEQYEAAFLENEIDETVLPSITAEDLRDIGVGPVGHRRKLLDAIAVFRADTSQKSTSSHGAITDAAERRQITVLFSDLVDSTTLSGRMDPEDMRNIIGLYHRCCTRIIEHNGGFVAKYMGDGVLAYFGYPQAHEHDAEHAVRAGLALVGAVSELETPATGIRLQVRVGIATGVVVVGDLIGSGEAQERSIVGETPNLAARLQGIAEPNTVVIAEGTRRLLGNLFELQDLGAKHLKGLVGSARAWSVLRASSVESRFEALHSTELTTLVGREEESELLLRRWAKAKTREGQVVLISGEAGIGKSRLTAALLERLSPEPHTRLRYFCSPRHMDSALYPVISQMERAAGLVHSDSPRAKLDKFGALLAQTSTSIEDMALLTEMLSLPTYGRYPALELMPQLRREKTLRALVLQIEALSRKNPVLMIFEDAHWIDPTSLEVLGRVVDRIATHRVLLTVTCRPEFTPPWIGQPHVTALIVNRLTQHEVGAMIDRIIGEKMLPACVRHDIIERTDGIPLFVEEITKAVLEAESEGAAERTLAAVQSPALAVPASLHASLMARLDRLGPAKEVMQIGGAIGREFSHSLLAAVVDKPEADLEAALDRIIAAGLLFRRGIPPHATYWFKHALVQDAAYGTLLREPRRALHARIAETVESQFAEVADHRPEILAHHCTEAGLIEKAAGLWGKAGQRSLSRSALVEAVEKLTRALAQMATLPAAVAVRGEEIKLQVALITPLMHVKGYAAPETKAALERARLLIKQAETLGEPTVDPLLLLSVLYGVWIANCLAFNGDVCRDLAAHAYALAEKERGTVPLIVGHRMMGASLLFTGGFAESRRHYDQAIALYDPPAHRPLATRFGQDSRVAILSQRSLTLWLLGYPEAALADADAALKDARELGHAATLMFALNQVAYTRLNCGKYAAANLLTDELIALADEKGAAFWKMGGIMGRGYLMVLTGETSNGVQLITSGLAAYQATGARLFIPLHLTNLARACIKLGQFDDARRRIDEAMTSVEATKERWSEAEVHCAAGELASTEPNEAKAEACFERALGVARQQQAKSWELRAATSLARLWRDQDKRHQAYDLVAPVYNWFTEGFDTLDLKEGEALLAELT
jgi:class 3 adenylate cyclase/tetratricopeptide (TPR) repeat protein